MARLIGAQRQPYTQIRKLPGSGGWKQTFNLQHSTSNAERAGVHSSLNVER
jgi:hypothetical protein